MTRRDLLKSAASLLPAARARAAVRPNILFLFADDQRFSTINNPVIRTPNIDRIVRRGTTFDHAGIMGGTIGAVCAPSRGMLMTGQTLFHAHEIAVAKEPTSRPFSLLPEVLGKAGYRTFHTGKWHNGPKLFARAFQSGENIFFGGMSNHLQVPVHDFNPGGQYPPKATHTGAKFSSELFSDSAIRFLREYKGDAPFFAYVAYTAPHDPRMAPDEFKAMYPENKVELPPNFLPEHPFDNGEMKVRDEALAPWPRTPEEIRKHIAAYYAMITHLDVHIGRVLDTLEATGRADNTIVIFAADNGLACGQHGLMGKQNLYDHSVRVPLVIAGPGLPKGQRTSSMCYLLDIFPTLCELTGVAAPPTLEGRSLAPALHNPKRHVRDSVFLSYREFQRGVRTDDWKLILYNVQGKQTTQLFDLRRDPWEMKNLAADPAQGTRVREMRTLLKKWMKDVDDPLDIDRPNWAFRGGAWSVPPPKGLGEE